MKEEPRTVKLSQVMDQSSNDQAPALSPQAVKAFYVAYKVIFKRFPSSAKECTVDQLSAVLSTQLRFLGHGDPRMDEEL